MKKIILSSVLLLSGFFIQAQQAPDKISFNSNCRPAGSPGQPYWEIMMTNMP